MFNHRVKPTKKVPPQKTTKPKELKRLRENQAKQYPLQTFAQRAPMPEPAQRPNENVVAQLRLLALINEEIRMRDFGPSLTDVLIILYSILWLLGAIDPAAAVELLPRPR